MDRRELFKKTGVAVIAAAVVGVNEVSSKEEIVVTATSAEEAEKIKLIKTVDECCTSLKPIAVKKRRSVDIITDESELLLGTSEHVWKSNYNREPIQYS